MANSSMLTGNIQNTTRQIKTLIPKFIVPISKIRTHMSNIICSITFVIVLTSFIKGLMSKVCVWIANISASQIKISGPWIKLGRRTGEFMRLLRVVNVSVSQIRRLAWSRNRAEADSSDCSLWGELNCPARRFAASCWLYGEGKSRNDRWRNGGEWCVSRVVAKRRPHGCAARREDRLSQDRGEGF
jgi:hypothetical protein